MEDAIAALQAILANLEENVQLLTAVQAENQGLMVEEDIELWQQQMVKYQGALDAQGGQVEAPASPVVAAV